MTRFASPSALLLSALAACCAGLLAWLPPAVAQTSAAIDEEELVELEAAPPLEGPALDEDELERLFAEAEEIFLADDPTAALPLFGHIVELIEGHLAEQLLFEETTRRAEQAAEDLEPAPAGDEPVTDEEPADETPVEGEGAAAPEEDGEAPPEPLPELRFLSDETRRLLTKSLAYRAEVQAGFGERELAEAVFERVLALDPETVLDREGADPEAVRVLERLRKRSIGDLTLLLEPPDAEVRIDGRKVDPSAGPISTLAGERWLVVERLGYETLIEQIDVEAGRQTSLDFALERIRPLLRLYTRPPGASVVLDGIELGQTEGTAPPGFLPVGSYQHHEFSAEWTWSEIEFGLRVLEVRKAGYRPYRAELRISELIDYPMPPIVLEPEAGQIILRNLPEDAEILIDSQPVLPENPGSSRPRITLAPGQHELQITAGATRMFTRSFLLADRQQMEVEIRLRPGLAFAGAIGGRGAMGASFSEAMQRTLADSDKWALLDRSREGSRTLSGLGISAEQLLAATEHPPSGELDWKAFQAAFDREAPGLLYVLAVLPDDLLANHARVLVWPAAPGPPRPDVVEIPLGEPGATSRMTEHLSSSIPLYRPWVGALLIDSAATGHPIVASVAPGSPADGAGLALGDEIVAVDQHEVTSSAAFTAFVDVAGIDGVLSLAVRTADGGGRNAELRVGESPEILSRASSGLKAVTFTDLSLMLDGAEPRDRWLVQLDRALLLLRAGEAEEAVRQLRKISAPQSSHGVSQATVDYWLALALIAADGTYLDAAKALLERAAGFEGARLGHHDGAFLAPRARARLRELGAGG